LLVEASATHDGMNFVQFYGSSKGKSSAANAAT
jgi:hypothetical protein